MTQQEVGYPLLWAVRGETEAQTWPTSPSDCVFHQRSGGRPSWEGRVSRHQTSRTLWAAWPAWRCPGLRWALSAVCLSVTPWAVALRAPLPTRFPKQGDWSGLPFPLPGELPGPREMVDTHPKPGEQDPSGREQAV